MRNNKSKRKRYNSQYDIIKILLTIIIFISIILMVITINNFKNIDKQTSTKNIETTKEKNDTTKSNEIITNTVKATSNKTDNDMFFRDVSSQVSKKFNLSLVAQKVILVDFNNKEILYSKNINEKTSPASTTKLMTAIIALEYLDVNKMITVGEEITLIAPDSSIAQLKIGDKLTVKQLIQGMLLSSGNDAAYVLAYNTVKEIDKNVTIKEGINKFVEMMNEYVKTIGLKNTNFESPDGYDTKNQYISAYDLAVITYKALSIPEIVNAVKNHSVYVKQIGVTWTSTNELTNPDGEYYYDKAIGLKTGSTEDAGKCLVAAAKDGDKEIFSIVLGSDVTGRWIDSIALLKYGFSVIN